MGIPDADCLAFRARYGPWSVVAGAAEGLGAAWAAALARRGLDLVLVDRRDDLLAIAAPALARARGFRAPGGARPRGA
jgi:short-subunit dehydrogenase